MGPKKEDNKERSEQLAQSVLAFMAAEPEVELPRARAK